MPGWKRSLGERLDRLIVGAVPNARKAVKWNQPFYGHEGEGWFLAFRCYTSYVQLQFPRDSLDPVPPKASKHERWLPRHLRGRRPRRGPAPLLDRTGQQAARREDVEPPATPSKARVARRVRNRRECLAPRARPPRGPRRGSCTPACERCARHADRGWSPCRSQARPRSWSAGTRGGGQPPGRRHR